MQIAIAKVTVTDASDSNIIAETIPHVLYTEIRVLSSFYFETVELPFVKGCKQQRDVAIVGVSVFL